MIFGTASLHRLLDEQRKEILSNLGSLGFTSIDTAFSYGYGLNNQLVAEHMSCLNQPIGITLKIGVRPRSTLYKRVWLGLFMAGVSNATKFPRLFIPISKASQFEEDFEQALLDLSVSKIDCLVLHQADVGCYERLNTFIQFGQDLIASGRVKRLGISGYTPRVLEMQAGHADSLEALQIPVYLAKTSLLQSHLDVTCFGLFGGGCKQGFENLTWCFKNECTPIIYSSSLEHLRECWEYFYNAR